MNRLPPAIWPWAVFCLIASLGLASVGHAAPPPPASAQAGQPEAKLETLIGQIRQKLADANAALAQRAARTAQPSSEAVAEQGEVVESGLLQQQLIRIYQRQLDNLLKLQSLGESRAWLESEAANWTGFPSPPPYSFLLVDGLREAVRAEQANVQALLSMAEALEQEFARRQELLEESAGKLRLANERLEGKGGSDPRLAWLRDLEAQRNRLAEARVEGIQVERRLNGEELAQARQRLDFARRQLDVARNQVAFGLAEREQVRGRLAAERQHLQAELDAATPALDARRKALAEVAEALKRERESQAKGEAAPRLAELEEVEALERERVENADIVFQMLTRLLDFNKLDGKVWELRWAQADSGGVGQAVPIYTQIAKMQEELRPMREYVEERLKLTSGQAFALENRLLDPAQAAAADRLRQLRSLYGEREADYRRLLQSLQASWQLLDLWRQDLDDKYQAAPLAERAEDWLARGRDVLAAVWQFELFAVEDTIEVEGQPVTGKRSVTLGKVTLALLILVVGLALSSRLSRLVERLAVRRGGMDASAARIARRWLMFLVGVALLMTSLVMVKIPLTVFAFTGGAVAIGLGFGMQNLLKNLISGLMLLLERPFRPGDLVEVAGIRGRVMDIGMRSSHIRDGNGIETLIPNSTFIEQNVTNWTLSSQSVRIVVKLGVAYGSPVQELAELLLEVAGRHGLVMDKPPPEVLFEDFGADALQFGLYVWVEIKPGVDWRGIASDLRFMINKTLAAHGIVMAFPQRDVHLDAAKPLEVRILDAAG